MTSLRLPKIAFTMGDPAGIGPEIIVRMLEDHPEFAEAAELFIYGSPEVIRDATGRFCKRPLPPFELVEATGVKVSHLADGILSAECGLAAYETVVRAAKAAVEAARLKKAMCTLRMSAVGHTPQGFGFGRALDAELMDVFGVELEAIEVRELLETARGYTDAD